MEPFAPEAWQPKGCARKPGYPRFGKHALCLSKLSWPSGCASKPGYPRFGKHALCLSKLS